MKRQKRLFPLAALVVLAITAAIALAPVASAKTEKLTGTVKVDKNRGQQGVKWVVTLSKGRRSVGSLHFPACAGAGLSFICGGALNLTGLGKGLSVLFTWQCHVPAGGGLACTKSATSPISDASGANKGSITLKTGSPSGLSSEKGKRFAVKVHPA